MAKRSAFLLVLLLAACGGGSESSPEDVAKDLGCDSFTEERTEELFVRSMYECGNTRVYFFNDTDARDDWWDIAKKVGGVELERGDRWIQVKA